MADRLKGMAWFQTLALSGLAATAQQICSTASSQPGNEWAIPAMGAAAVASVVGGYLTNRGTSQREAEARQALVERNHHLRRGMAAALRKGLRQFSLTLNLSDTSQDQALFTLWDGLLAQAENDDAMLEQFFPAQFAESHWEATNTYSPNAEEDAQALAMLLREWLTTDAKLYSQWSPTQALDLSRRALPFYQQAFVNDLAGDADGLLMRAFTVKGINQIRALAERLVEQNQSHDDWTRLELKEIRNKVEEIKDHLQPRLMDLGEVRTWALPMATGYFSGREEFLTTLHAALQEKRKVLVSASGGFGKTQAALEYVRRYGGHYDDVLWVQANDSASLYAAYRTITLGLHCLAPDSTTDAEVQQALKSWLAEHPNVLLVMDNLDDPESAKPYWPTAANSQPFVLATSQRRDVSELDRMYRLDLNVLSPAEALEFFERRMDRATLTGDERTAAEQLGEEIGYLPLALEQAAAYIQNTGVSFSQYLNTCRRIRLALLKKNKPVAGNYPYSVATTWKASRERLLEAARELLDALSHLSPSGVPLELISSASEALGPVLSAALTDDSEVEPLATVLASLQEYSLVRVDMASRTLSLHRLLQEVVREDQPASTRDEWLGRWIEVFMKFLPSNADYRESLPHIRAWPAFQAVFLAITTEHEKAEEALSLADGYSSHFWQRARYREAETIILRLYQLSEQVLEAEHPSTLTLLNNLAALYRSQGRYAEAEPLLVRGLAAFERVLGPEHPGTLRALNNMAELHRAQGHYAKAEPLYVRALTTRERVLGPEHPDTLNLLNNLAGLYHSQGRYAKAEPLLVRGLAASERVLGPEHPDTLNSLNNLAGLYHSQGHYAKAEPLYVRALITCEHVMGAEHPSTLSSLNNLAGLYSDQGRYAKAEPLFVRALKGFQRTLGDKHPSTVVVRNNLALLGDEQQ